jgi:hypothetical protein
MSRRTWYCFVFSLSLLAPILQAVLSVAEAIRLRHEILVSSGETAPARGNYSPFSLVDHRQRRA